MARVILGPLINDIRGSIGNQVFDNYNGVHIVRAKPSYITNPQSAQQSKVRLSTATFVSAWQSLTLAQQQAWCEVAHTFPTGKESDAKLSRGGLVTVPRGPFSAWNAFLACNMNRYMSGYSTITDVLIVPPVGLSLPEPLKSVSATSSTGSITFSWTYINPGPKNERLEVWIKSNDALVHPQMIYTEARNADGSVTITSVRSRGGLYIVPPRGTYRLQAQIVDKYGRTSQPSELVLTRILGDDMFTYLSDPVLVLNLTGVVAPVARTPLSLAAQIPAGAHSAILRIQIQQTAFGAAGNKLATYRDAVVTIPQMEVQSDTAANIVVEDEGLQPIDTARAIEYGIACGAASTLTCKIYLIGYIS